MKIKETFVEVKKSKNFQTFSCSELITLEDKDDLATVRKEAFDRCRLDVLEQIKIDETPDGIESLS